MQIHQNKSLAQPIGLALFVFFGAFVFSAFASHSFTPVGDSSAVESDVNVEIEPSLSLAIMDKDPSVSSDATTIDTMSMEVTPTNASGVFISSTAYVVAGSNNETGYTLSFSDTDNNTALTNTDPTITTNIPSIAVSSSSLIDIAVNQWGYAFNTDTVFSPIPALSSPITLASTTIPASNVYPFTAASKIDMNVPSGVYQDSLVFSLVANYVAPKTATLSVAPIITYLLDGGDTFIIDTDIDYTDSIGDIIVSIYNSTSDKAVCTSPVKSNESGKLRVTCTSPARAIGQYDVELNLLRSNRVYVAETAIEYKNPIYTIAYDANGGTGTTTATTATYNTAHTLATNGFTRDNYIFLGWDTSDTATTAAYSGSQALTASQLNTLVSGLSNGDTKTLYAIWRAMTINDITQMQQINSTICLNSAIGESATLTDTRDDEAYTVKKLADSKCWMTQNLRLARSKAVTLTSADSDVSSNFSLPQAPTAISSWGSAANGATDINKIHLYNTSNVSYGVYYNWYTATAGTGTYIMTSDTASSSICPKGWRLPTGYNGDFRALYTAENNDVATFINDGAWTLSGRYYYNTTSGSFDHRQGSYGYWWSSMQFGLLPAVGMYISSSSVRAEHEDGKLLGFSVRCLAR